MLSKRQLGNDYVVTYSLPRVNHYLQAELFGEDYFICYNQAVFNEMVSYMDALSVN